MPIVSNRNIVKARRMRSIFAFLKSVFTALWYPVDGTEMIDMFGGDPLTLSVDPSSTTFDDYYMPSWAELNAVYTNLHLNGIGNYPNNIFWTSTESDIEVDNDPANEAYVLPFYSGDKIDIDKTASYRFLPVRHFTALEGAYAVGDKGPANGWIFYVDGTTYYETAPEGYVITDVVWSNIMGSAVGTTDGIGAGATNTAAIVAQTGHTTSVAQECLDYSVDVGDGAIGYIPSNYAGTITAPDVAGLKTADTDNILFDVGGTPQALSVSDLITTDLERIPVKYDNLAPHHIRMIGLLDPTVYATLTPADKRKISNYMDLWVFFWGGWLDAGSVNKENRTI